MPSQQALDLLISANPEEALAAFSQIEKKLNELNQKTEEPKSGFEKLTQAMLGIDAFMNISGRVLGALQSLGSTVADFGVKTVGYFAETADFFEQMGVKFTTVFGGEGPAQKALDWAVEFGVKTPKTLDEVTKEMLKMQTFGLKPMEGNFEKIGDAAYALGQETDGIVTALGQMGLKGKVSAEELMQLSERNIPAFQILKDTFNLTSKEMENLGNAGLPVQVAIQAIIDNIGAMNAGAMEMASRTVTGMLSTIEDGFQQFAKKFTDSGPWDTVRYYVGQVKDFITESLGSESFLSVTEAAGQAFADVAAEAIGFLQVVAESFLPVGVQISDLPTLFLSKIPELTDGFGSLVEYMITGWGTVKTAFAVAWNAVIDVVKTLNFADWFTTLTGSITAVGGLAVGVVGSVVGALGEGIGKFIEGIAYVGEAFSDYLPQSFGDAVKVVSDFGSGFGDIAGVVGEASRSITEFGFQAGESLVNANKSFDSMKINIDDITDSEAKMLESWKKADPIGDRQKWLDFNKKADEEIQKRREEEIARVKDHYSQYSGYREKSEADIAKSAKETAKALEAAEKEAYAKKVELTKDAFDEVEKAQKQYYAEAKRALKEQAEAEKEALVAKQAQEKEYLDKKYERTSQAYEAEEKMIKARYDAERQRIEDTIDALEEKLEAELSILKAAQSEEEKKLGYEFEDNDAARKKELKDLEQFYEDKEYELNKNLEKAKEANNDSEAERIQDLLYQLEKEKEAALDAAKERQRLEERAEDEKMEALKAKHEEALRQVEANYDAQSEALKKAKDRDLKVAEQAELDLLEVYKAAAKSKLKEDEKSLKEKQEQEKKQLQKNAEEKKLLLEKENKEELENIKDAEKEQLAALKDGNKEKLKELKGYKDEKSLLLDEEGKPVLDGKDGKDGQPGKDGKTKVVTVKIDGEELVLKQFYEYLMERALNDAIAQGVMVVSA